MVRYVAPRTRKLGAVASVDVRKRQMEEAARLTQQQLEPEEQLNIGALIFLTTYGTTDELKASLISGGIAALGALGFRGAEGKYDARRQASGNVKPSDVGQ